MKKIIDRKTEGLQAKLLSSSEYNKLCYEFNDPLVELKKYLKQLGISNKSLAIKLGATESHVSKMLSGERVTRDNLLKICIVAKLDLETTNQLLKYLSFHTLYVKNQRDAPIIFGISNEYSIEEINKILAKENILLL